MRKSAKVLLAKVMTMGEYEVGAGEPGAQELLERGLVRVSSSRRDSDLFERTRSWYITLAVAAT